MIPAAVTSEDEQTTNETGSLEMEKEKPQIPQKVGVAILIGIFVSIVFWDYFISRQ